MSLSWWPILLTLFSERSQKKGEISGVFPGVSGFLFHSHSHFYFLPVTADQWDACVSSSVLYRESPHAV